MLLADITKGKKLKKTVTVDKSAPMISGKVPISSSNTSHAHSGSQTLSRHSNNSSNISMNGPKLGGIFGDMGTMPRLKPVGSRTTGKCFYCFYLEKCTIFSIMADVSGQNVSNFQMKFLLYFCSKVRKIFICKIS